MICDLTHHKWRKKLLESRKKGVIYRINNNKEEDKCILMMYGDGIWQLGLGDSYNVEEFVNVDSATEYIITKGVDDYDIHFDMIRL
ncbi:hypothetical protein [Neobacillus sp. NPDC093127]|uniref:hypothetical protein n=1 Tax=Neobacillus sp. NPDC093127 TaxID=3364296 RepID=UPI0038036D46